MPLNLEQVAKGSTFHASLPNGRPCIPRLIVERPEVRAAMGRSIRAATHSKRHSALRPPIADLRLADVTGGLVGMVIPRARYVPPTWAPP